MNDEDTPRRAAISGEITYAPKSLVYWSVTERKWKPLPRATRKAMRAARTAAAEVENFVASQPAMAQEPLKAISTPADENPNYNRIAKGRAVTIDEVEQAIKDAAMRHKVDPNLVRAMIKVESNFNPRAVSSKGAMGLMQLMPSTAKTLKVHNPFDVKENVDAGVRHFRRLLENYKGNVQLSLAAYNAGERAVDSHGGIPPFRETRNYVRAITDLYNGEPVRLDEVTKAPIKVFRDNQGVLNFSNVD